MSSHLDSPFHEKRDLIYFIETACNELVKMSEICELLSAMVGYCLSLKGSCVGSLVISVRVLRHGETLERWTLQEVITSPYLKTRLVIARVDVI